MVLALDADNGGQAAMERLADEFRQAGLAVSLCPPPQDQWGKDWSERWRRLDPQSMWPLYEALSHRQRGVTSKPDIKFQMPEGRAPHDTHGRETQNGSRGEPPGR